MKKTGILFLLVGLLACIGCVKSLNDAVMDLEKIHFPTEISDLVPESTKDAEIEGWYKVKGTSLEKDTVYEDEFDETKQAKWIEYRERSASTADTLAKFNLLSFNTINLVATLDHQLILFNGIIENVPKKDNQKFIEYLNKNYGQAKKSQGEFLKPFDVYTWTLADRVIKYIPMLDDERNTFKIVVDHEKHTIEADQKTPHYKGLVFVIYRKYADSLIGNMHTGELLYCQ